MAFQEVEPELGGQDAGRCKYSVKLKHGGARISVPARIVGEMGWTSATRLKLFVGAAESEGQLRLLAHAAGKIVPRLAPKGGGLYVRLGRWPGLAPRDVDGIAVEVIADKTAASITITIPAHARLVAPASRAEAMPAGSGGGQRPAQRIDATSRVLGRDGAAKITMGSGMRGGK